MPQVGFVIRDKTLEKYNGTLTEVIIPDGVVAINQKAFYRCSGITKVIITSSVTMIGAWAFFECEKLKIVIIPSSVTSIGMSAFKNCTALTKVKISKENWNKFQDNFSNTPYYKKKKKKVPVKPLPENYFY